MPHKCPFNAVKKEVKLCYTFLTREFGKSFVGDFTGCGEEPRRGEA